MPDFNHIRKSLLLYFKLQRGSKPVTEYIERWILDNYKDNDNYFGCPVSSFDLITWITTSTHEVFFNPWYGEKGMARQIRLFHFVINKIEKVSIGDVEEYLKEINVISNRPLRDST